jgi:RHS repeat-associated protein
MTDYSSSASRRLREPSCGLDGTSTYVSGARSESYTLDDNGNRTASHLHTSYNPQTAGNHNRLTSDGTYSYKFDDEGNLEERTHDSTGAIVEYFYDHRSRLTRVIERGSSTGPITKQTDFTYDALNRRIVKSHDADGPGAGAAILEKYVYDGDNILLQYNGSDVLTHRYTHGEVTDQVFSDESLLDAQNLFTLADHQGSIRDLALVSSGALANHINFDSYGRILSETNTAVDSLFGYTNREFDEETGLQYNRARYYSPDLGRFISQDPAGFSAGDANLYRYVGNSPLMLIDPSGLGSTSYTDVGSYSDGSDIPLMLRSDLVPWDMYEQRARDQQALLATLEAIMAPPPTTYLTGMDYVAMNLIRDEEIRLRAVNSVTFTSAMLDIFEDGLTLIGMTDFPLVSQAADITSGSIAGLRGDDYGFTLSMAAAAVGGQGAGAARLLRTADNATDLASSYRILARNGALADNVAGELRYLDNFSLDNAPVASRTVDLRVLNSHFVPNPTAILGSGNAYSVAAQIELPATAYPGRSRGYHFQQANTSLLQTMNEDPVYGQQIESLIPDIRQQLILPRSISREPPAGWTWHHQSQEGIMQLVPRVQHEAAGPLQRLLHPNGQGGMSTWGK